MVLIFNVYRVMVHEAETLAAAQEYYYLRYYLNGQAMNLVRLIPLSDGNYEAAIKALK